MVCVVFEINFAGQSAAVSVNVHFTSNFSLPSGSDWLPAKALVIASNPHRLCLNILTCKTIPLDTS